MDLKIEFTDKEITPWGGLILMKKLLDYIGFKEYLREIGLPERGSNRGYDSVQIITSFMIGVWCGANRFEHLEVTRMDKVIQEMYGWKRMAGHKAYLRYFKKFNIGKNQEIFEKLYGWLIKKINFNNYTLDVDSTVITRYGEQEGAKRGYNDKKRGRKSHHPIIAFLSDIRMVANFWLRRGDAHTANNFKGFIEDTLNRLEGKRIGLLRGDNGFFDNKIMEYLEERKIHYIIGAKFYKPIKRILISERIWWNLEEGIDIAETEYKSPGWKKERRVILVRQDIKKRPKASGRELCLFGENEPYKEYRYSCFVTNLDLPASTVWTLYKQRADAENRIKEIKHDFGGESFNLREFFATEAALNFAMLAYNLMSLFRQVILKTKHQQHLKTLRYKLFGIAAYITSKGNAKILKLALNMKRRYWFLGLWNSIEHIDFPYPVPDSS